ADRAWWSFLSSRIHRSILSGSISHCLGVVGLIQAELIYRAIKLHLANVSDFSSNRIFSPWLIYGELLGDFLWSNVLTIPGLGLWSFTGLFGKFVYDGTYGRQPALLTKCEALALNVATGL